MDFATIHSRNTQSSFSGFGPSGGATPLRCLALRRVKLAGQQNKDIIAARQTESVFANVGVAPRFLLFFFLRRVSEGMVATVSFAGGWLRRNLFGGFGSSHRF